MTGKLVSRPLTFPSGDLTLEGMLHLSAEAPGPGVVVCHPHTQYGGDMDNSVVLAACATLAADGVTLASMDNGHSYPPDCLFRLDVRRDPAATQRQIVDELRRRYPSDWPAIWSLVWSHREACMIGVLQSLDAALSRPKMTRQGLRRSMLAALEAIAERGPEGVRQGPTRP